MPILIAALLTALLIYLAHRYVRGEDLKQWDSPVEPIFRDLPPSDIHQQAVAQLKVRDPKLKTLSPKELLVHMRQLYDDSGTKYPVEAKIIVVDNAPVKGEWVVAEGSDSTKRMLFIHGGAFRLGSPRSHRAIAGAMSKALGGPVFLPDYRLSPEHHRSDCVTDARLAYEWIWHNAPNHASRAEHVIVAGDSAGGNLALGLLPWIRDNNQPRATACVALSPGLDSTASGKSYKANLDSDTLLKPLLSILRKIPNWALPWAALLHAKVLPSAPHISPIFDKLHDLPPTLVQASTHECLEDDSRRWTNKARAAGSPVTLQMWSNMLHVWQSLVNLNAPEAIDAFEQIQLFIHREIDKAQAAKIQPQDGVDI